MRELNANGQFVGLPDATEVDWPELQAALEKIDRVDETITVSYEATKRYQAEVARAGELEVKKAAEAIAAGATKVPTPGTAAAQAKQKLEQAETLLEASREAKKIAWEELLAIVDRNRAAWKAQAKEMFGQGAADYVAVIDSLGAARARMLFLEWLVRWTTDFPYGRTKMVATTIMGSDKSFEEFVLALRREAGAARPEPRTLGEHIRAAGREPVAGVA